MGKTRKRKPKGLVKPGDSLEVILDSIADGVFTIDRDRRITSFNRAAEQITGFSCPEALGRYCFEIFRASICRDTCAMQQTLESGKPLINIPVNILTRDGRQIPISISTAVLRDKSGDPLGGVETFRDLSPMEELRKELQDKYTFEDIVSRNHRMRELFGILPDIAESDSTVLIQGPSGSGKELFARAIHELSPRREKPYVTVTCGALPDALLESELFGYVKGAFTNALKDKPGRFAVAEGGTVFLDEVGDISPAVQVKLLRVLQDRSYEPLGSSQTVWADVRIVAATNRDLEAAVAARDFRQDLFYRLKVITLELPPLAQRREDIPLLVDHFLRRQNLKQPKGITGVSDDVMDLFMRHDFPGNVRELENLIEHASVLCRAMLITPADLPKEFVEKVRSQAPRAKEPSPLTSAEAEAIRSALDESGGNRVVAARRLGISRSTLWRKIRAYKIHQA